jgi:polysaccharide biosynthesis protein PslH
VATGRVIVVLTGSPYPYGEVTGRWAFPLLKGLALRGFLVRCLSVSTRSDWDAAARALLEPMGVSLRSFAPRSGEGWLARKVNTLQKPFSYVLSDALRRAIDEETREGYDALQLEQLWAGYLADGRERTLTSVHYLPSLDLKDEWRFSSSFLWSKYLMCRTEQQLLRSLSQVRTLSPRLERAVMRVNPALHAHTVPVSVDPELFEFSSRDRHDGPVFGFIGNMAWSPGYLAAVRLITRILPRVRTKIPAARVLLVGWNARRLLRKYLNVAGVEVVQDVADARPYFERLQVLAYPLPKGSGMMIKVLEAMAYGIPVVTTSEGFEGIDAEDGVHGLIADDDEMFAMKVVDALGDVELRQRLRRQARRLVEEHYAPAATASALERVYQRL